MKTDVYMYTHIHIYFLELLTAFLERLTPTLRMRSGALAPSAALRTPPVRAAAASEIYLHSSLSFLLPTCSCTCTMWDSLPSFYLLSSPSPFLGLLSSTSIDPFQVLERLPLLSYLLSYLPFFDY